MPVTVLISSTGFQHIPFPSARLALEVWFCSFFTCRSIGPFLLPVLYFLHTGLYIARIFVLSSFLLYFSSCLLFYICKSFSSPLPVDYMQSLLTPFPKSLSDQYQIFKAGSFNLSRGSIYEDLLNIY